MKAAMITMGMPMNTVNAFCKLRMSHIIRAGGAAVLSGFLSWAPVLQASGEDATRAVKQAYGASPDAPTELVTQYVTNPMAVDALPRFSGALRDIDRDERQTAYQIIVALTLASINGNVGNIWDSGRTFSLKSTQVHYAGNPLASDTRYWWKVRTWDKEGNASPWSAFANFDMGLTTTDWTASHIWDGTDNVNNFAYFRKKFPIPAGKTIAIAKLYVSAHDDYNLYINGKQIGIGPAFSNPYKRMYYIGYDITASLSAGDNAITSICHWHGLFRMGGGKSAVPAFILQMRIKYTDGTSQTIKTDNSWKILATTPWLESPHAFQGISWSDMRCVENYDARKEIPGWQTIAFDDSSWANATVVDRSMFMLKAQYVATDAVQQILNPVSITQSGTAWIVDFGMCYNGWPRLTITGNTAGSVVTIRYAEVPNDFRDYDTYTCKGGTETWQPDIRYESFRYLKIEGYAGTLTEANIKAAWKYATPDRHGAFECSNTLFNNIYNLSERSCRQNIQEGVESTDAWRETSSYTADAYLMTGVCLYNYKNSMVLRKTIADYADEQYANGNLDAHCPNSGGLDIPEWTLHWFFLLWNQYLFFGDRDILAEH
jgi:alpha-L-rhamnosidase